MSASAPLKQIGDDDHPFKGTFDGNGHVISGLTISGHSLFGNLSGTVKKLGLVNMKFTGGNDYCAPFAYKAGGSADASILDCYAGGNITVADNTNAGTILAELALRGFRQQGQRKELLLPWRHGQRYQRQRPGAFLLRTGG